MPQWSADERNPSGAVTPPSARAIAKGRAVEETLAMKRCQRHKRVRCLRQGKRDRVLSASSEERAGATVCLDLLGNPRVRDDRKAHAHEVPGRVRERTQRLEASGSR